MKQACLMLLSGAFLSSGTGLAATLVKVDKKQQQVVLVLDPEEAKGCCTRESRLEVFKDEASMGDFEVTGYSAKQKKVRLNVADAVSQFSKKSSYTASVFSEPAGGTAGKADKDLSGLSIEEKVAEYDKLIENYRSLRAKMRESRKKVDQKQKEKMAAEVKAAEERANAFYDRNLGSAVFRNLKTISFGGEALLIGFPFQGLGLGLHAGWLVGADHQLELRFSGITGSKTEDEIMKLSGDQLSLAYRWFFAGSFNLSAGLYQSTYYMEYSYADFKTFRAYTYELTGKASGLQLTFGNRWQKRTLMLGLDYLNLQIPAQTSLKTGKERSTTEEERVTIEEKADKQLKSVVASLVFSIGASF